MENGSLGDKLSIETPEQIRLEFPLAGIGSRFLALAYDTLIQLLAGLVLGLLGLFIFLGSLEAPQSSNLWLGALLILLLFLIQFGYFAFFEALWQGQTPGKRLQHLRVLRDNGQSITGYDAVARNLLRMVDSLPGFYAVGILSVLVSPQNKRLGDYVAGTVVVHEKPLEQPSQPGFQYEERAASGYDVARLSPEEFQLLESYLLRRNQLSPEVRMQLTQRILQRLAPKLGISPEDQRNPEPLLEKLVVEYRSRARFL